METLNYFPFISWKNGQDREYTHTQVHTEVKINEESRVGLETGMERERRGSDYTKDK